MRAKPGFSHLSGLVFLVYLLFGLGGSLVSVCCAGAESSEACLAVTTAGEASPALILLDRAEEHCLPCLDHCQAVSPELVHLAARPLTPRPLQSLASPLFLTRQLPDVHTAAAGIFLDHSPPAQNSVLRVLRSTVLLI